MIELARHRALPSFEANRYALILVGGYPLLWSIGLAGVFWLLLLPAAVAVLTKAKFSVPELLLMIIGLLIIVSIPVGVIHFEFEVGRVLGALGNAAVWIGTAGLCVMMRGNQVREKFLDCILLVGGFQGAMTLLSLAIYPSRLPLPLLGNFSAIYSLPAGVFAFAENRLYYIDWLGDTAFRSSGVMANPTWAGAFAALCSFFVVQRLMQQRRKAYHATILALCAVSIYLSLSRATLLGLGLAAVVGLFCIMYTKRPNLFWPVALPSFLVGVMAWILVQGSIVNFMVALNEEREGSLETRSDIYGQTIDYVEDLAVPLIGYGIKPQEDGLVASVATHSTYLGLLFRGGILAFAVLLVLTILLLRRAAHRDFYTVASIAFVAIWCVLEDLDGGHLVPVFLALATANPRGPQTKSDEVQEADNNLKTKWLK